jgi:hypothetical protein
VQHSKNESQKIEAFVSVVRYAIHEQMFCLWVSSPQRFQEKPQF